MESYSAGLHEMSSPEEQRLKDLSVQELIDHLAASHIRVSQKTTSRFRKHHIDGLALHCVWRLDAWQDLKLPSEDMASLFDFMRRITAKKEEKSRRPAEEEVMDKSKKARAFSHTEDHEREGLLFCCHLLPF